MKRKVCFILEASKQGGEGGRQARVQRSLPTDNRWARAFTDRARRQHVETAPLALTVILKLVSLRPFLGIRVAYVLTRVWSSCKLPPSGDFNTYKTAQRTWLRILSITPEVLDFAH